MAGKGNREGGGGLKSTCRSDMYTSSSDNPQRFTAAPTAWNTSSVANGHDEQEVKRQRRIAKYKAYAVESKLKSSLRNGIRWVKIKCSELLHR